MLPTQLWPRTGEANKHRAYHAQCKLGPLAKRIGSGMRLQVLRPGHAIKKGLVTHREAVAAVAATPKPLEDVTMWADAGSVGLKQDASGHSLRRLAAFMWMMMTKCASMTMWLLSWASRSSLAEYLELLKKTLGDQCKIDVPYSDKQRDDVGR